jgi:hypothetical protein
MRRFALIAALLLVAGCSHDPYTASIAASKTVSDSVSQAIPILEQYYSGGKLTDAEKANIANYLGAVTDANMKFRAAAVQLHNQGVTGPSAYVQLAAAFVNAVPTDPTAFAYHSADSQKEFNIVLGTVKAAVDGIAIIISNAKPAAVAATQGAK